MASFRKLTITGSLLFVTVGLAVAGGSPQEQRHELM
jgi:hypothetical protein